MKREIFWEAHPDSTSFPSGGRKIYHERSAIGDMLSAIQNIAMRGLGSEESSLYSFMGGKMMQLYIGTMKSEFAVWHVLIRLSKIASIYGILQVRYLIQK